jgi:LmbE family N-acetylglucosaminyl deacetylase
MSPPLRILIIGAHPDDADIKAGGSAALWCRLGHRVCLVSMTDGGAGHHVLRGPTLAERRRNEARAAAAAIGASYEVFNYRDGELLADLPTRHRLIRYIRAFRPDLILTHRPNDYHPDHRYTSVLVQDAAYMITVPAVCPDAPHLERNPVILYLSDDFKKPAPFSADVVVDIGEALDSLVDMLHCHASQFYEWLPYNGGYLDQVPASELVRLSWLKERLQRRIRPLADRYRAELLRTYGAERGQAVEYIEAFELSEYGAPLDAGARARLFPFLPATAEPTAPPEVQEWADVRGDA